MAGNVWEWLSDDFYFYPGDDDPTLARCDVISNCKLFRGCSWGSIASYCRAAARGMRAPNHQTKWLGMRLVRTLPANK